MVNTGSVLIYVRKTALNKHGLCPINIRVTIGGARVDFTTGRFIKPPNWSAATEKALGQSAEAKELNGFLFVLRSKVFQIQKKLMTLDIPINPEQFRKEWSLSANTNTIELLTKLVYPDLQLVVVNDTFYEPQYGTNMVEKDVKKLEQLYRLGK